MAVGLAVLADSFGPPYYGADFSVAVLPLILLLPGDDRLRRRPLQATSQGSGRLRVLIVATGVAAGMNLVLNGLLIPLYGMTGAAVATGAVGLDELQELLERFSGPLGSLIERGRALVPYQ
jgi:O-antigen/teichoic acid export membrane protein